MNGQRRTVSLAFKATSRPAVFALNKQWPSGGVWSLVIGVTQGEGDGNTAYAVVGIGANGKVRRWMCQRANKVSGESRSR